MENFNIVSLFFDAARKFPDKKAIITRKNSITFQELESQVKHTSHYFLQKGIKKNDRVMVFVPMSIDLYRIVLALFNIGATAVFLDEWVGKKRMEQCCDVAACQAFIGVPKIRVLAWFSPAIRRIPLKLGLKYRIDKRGSEILTTVTRNDTALITFTTGSTGVPKAAKRTHGFLDEQFKALTQLIQIKEEEVDMPLLPIVLLINLGSGCTSVICDYKARKPMQTNWNQVIRLISENKVSRIVSSPYFALKLAEHVLSDTNSIKTVSKLFTGGAPVFPQEARILQSAFPKAEITIVYGSTEAEPISSINAQQLESELEISFNKGLKAGFPDPNITVRIIEMMNSPIYCSGKDDLNNLSLPNGEIGEIIVSGSHVLREYYNNDEALLENKIFYDDKCWHRTGDSGYIDEEGMLRLTGRCSTLFYAEGKLISPFTYENYLKTLPGVSIGTVMQIGKQIFTLIELLPGANTNYIEKNLRNMELNSTVMFLVQIPRDPRHFSKIDYSKLRVMLERKTS